MEGDIMFGKNKNALSGILNKVNDATRTINNVQRTTTNVQRTTDSVKRSVGGNKPNKQSRSATPDKNAWTCMCGTTNTTKFCGGCGKGAPAEVACVECGWKRPPENSSMKFCGECGTAFEVV
jgi:membrane protease subunit (stomatin/prohibitin family)